MPGSIHQVRRHAGHADNSCRNGIPDLQLVHGQHQLENHVYVLGGLWSDVGPSGQAQRKQLGQPGNYHRGGSEQRERRRGDDLCRVAAICDEFAARRDDDREVDGRRPDIFQGHCCGELSFELQSQYCGDGVPVRSVRVGFRVSHQRISRADGGRRKAGVYGVVATARQWRCAHHDASFRRWLELGLRACLGGQRRRTGRLRQSIDDERGNLADPGASIHAVDVFHCGESDADLLR